MDFDDLPPEDENYTTGDYILGGVLLGATAFLLLLVVAVWAMK
jgi:hypothetical protein